MSKVLLLRVFIVVLSVVFVFGCSGGGGDPAPDGTGNNGGGVGGGSGGGGGGDGNNPPIAHISVIDGVTLGAVVTASGSGSSDPDGDSLSYQWQLGGPVGSSARLDSADSETVSFTPDMQGSFDLSLVVSDGEAGSTSVSRTITVQPPLSGQKIVLKNTAAGDQSDIPFTFATVFTKGERNANQEFALQLDTGQILYLQTNAQATHADGSLRHAVFSGVIPSLTAQQEIEAELIPVSSTVPAQVAGLQALLDSGWDATIELNLDGEPYRASAAGLLAVKNEKLWLDGNLVREWVVDGAFKDTADNLHPHLQARFNVRVYGNLEHIRVSAVVENNWTFEASPRNYTYDVVVKDNGNSVFSQTGLTHLRHARWRKVFWSTGQPGLHIAHDPAYLMASGAVPNFDPSLIRNIDPGQIDIYENTWVDENVTIAVNASGYFVEVGSGGFEFTYNKIGPMGLGFAAAYMPQTGARDDIGPLPRWGAIYILNQDETSKKVALEMGQQGGSWPMHYRDRATGLPVSIDDYPYALSFRHVTTSINPDTGRDEHVALCTGSDTECVVPYTPDTAHQPSLAYVPYLVTGDHFFLEEMQFWAAFNLIEMNPYTREMDAGLFAGDMQDRAQAWSMRTLAQTAYITPDHHALKPYFENKLANNLNHYHQKYVVGSPNTYGAMIPNYSYPTASPWMDDFFTWAIGFIVDLGYESAGELLLWKAKFPIQRMGFGSAGNDDYCWIFAPAYHVLVAPDKDSAMFPGIAEVYQNTNGQTIPWGGAFDDQGTECASQAQADVLGLQKGEMISYSSSPTGSPSVLQAALAAAVTANAPYADDAWQRFMNRSVKPDYGGYPNYAIVPRN